MRHVSATQLSMYMACPRKWMLSYEYGLKAPQSASMAFGTAAHGAIEDYLNDGLEPEGLDRGIADPTFAARVKDALRYLPKTLTYIETEVPIREKLTDGLQYVGFIDLLDLSYEEEPHIIDYKTTADIDKYAKTEEQLKEDTQMLTYAKFVSKWREQAKTFKLSHLAIQTQKAVKAQMTSTTVTRDHVQKRWAEKFLPVIQEMEEWRGKDVRDVPHVFGTPTCQEYGGCFHKSRCEAAMFGIFPVRKDKEPMINPPKNEAPAPGTIDLFETVGDVPDLVVERAPDPQAELKKAAAEALTQPAGISDPDTVPKRGRGRPKKTAEVFQAIDASIPTVMGVPVATAVYPLTGPALFINCAPVKGMQAVSIYDFLAPLCDEIRRDTGLPWELHQYRQGEAALKEKVRNATLPAAIYGDNATGAAKIALEVLIPQASLVVQS
jgi:CRISPR/Cas system-associated exonuclease Cas4 (RecB family)